MLRLLLVLATVSIGRPAGAHEEWPPSWLEGRWKIQSRTVSLEGREPTFNVALPFAYSFKGRRQYVHHRHTTHTLTAKGFTVRHETAYVLYKRPNGGRLLKTTLTNTPNGVEMTTISEMPDGSGTLKVVRKLQRLTEQESEKLGLKR